MHPSEYCPSKQSPGEAKHSFQCYHLAPFKESHFAGYFQSQFVSHTYEKIFTDVHHLFSTPEHSPTAAPISWPLLVRNDIWLLKIHPCPMQRSAVAHSNPKNMPQAPREEFHEMPGVLAASLRSVSSFPEQLLCTATLKNFYIRGCWFKSSGTLL